jgi:hypothetical protein
MIFEKLTLSIVGPPALVLNFSCSYFFNKFPTQGITIIEPAFALPLKMKTITDRKRVASEILGDTHIKYMEDSLENIEVVLVIKVIRLKSVFQLIILDIKLGRVKASESVVGSGDVLDLKNSNSGHISPPKYKVQEHGLLPQQDTSEVRGIGLYS